MSNYSAIEWTESTWNPVTGCDRVAAGCDNCYALALAKRLKAMGAEKYQNDGDPRTSGPGFGVTIHPTALKQPYRWRAPRVVFVNSMSDLFHAKVPISFVRDIFDVIRETPQHTYQVLTKRAHRMARFADKLDWPDNLWMGVSVESFDAVDRIDHLRATPAAVRFLSCEPLLSALPGLNLADIDWVIAGGESGHNRARERGSPQSQVSALFRIHRTSSPWVRIHRTSAWWVRIQDTSSVWRCAHVIILGLDVPAAG